MTEPLSPQKLGELFQEIDNEPTGKLSQLAKIAGLRLAEDYIGADLSGEDLSKDDLREANFQDGNLSNTNLSCSDLSRANLSRANLSGANLMGANLMGADLSGANLMGANLSGAILDGAILDGAILDGANLREKADLINYHIDSNILRKKKQSLNLSQNNSGLVTEPKSNISVISSPLSHNKVLSLKSSEISLNSVRMSSGLTIIHQYLPVTPVVAADVWVNAGVTAEPESWSGIAHFLTHMVFKGTKNVLPGDFDYVVESNGGFANAATSYDYTHFFLTTASQYLPETLPYLGEILLQAKIPDDEFYLEREVVLEEIRSSYDDYDWVSLQAINNNIYQQHPYRKSVLGEENLLLKQTPNQMRCFHKTHYQPENMTVILVGDINLDKAVNLVEKNFSNFSIRSECPPVNFDIEPPIIEIRRQEIFLPRLEQSRLIMGWMGPGIENLEGAIALDMLSLIIAGGRNSRLVKKLREELNLVLNIACQFFLQKHSSLFTICAYLEPDKIAQVEYLIRQEIYELQKEPVTKIELINCQKGLCHDFIFSTETPEQLAGLYGYYQILENAHLAQQYPQIIKKLTAEILQSYACQYLSPEYYAITILLKS